MHAVGQLHFVGGPVVQAQVASLSSALAEKYETVYNQITEGQEKEKKWNQFFMKEEEEISMKISHVCWFLYVLSRPYKSTEQ